MWVPDEEQEAMRDLTRAREDMKSMELKARQRLCAFLLRHARVYREGKSRWTQRYFRWLEEQRFENPVQQEVFQEYVDTVMEAHVILGANLPMTPLPSPHRAVATSRGLPRSCGGLRRPCAGCAIPSGRPGGIIGRGSRTKIEYCSRSRPTLRRWVIHDARTGH